MYIRTQAKCTKYISGHKQNAQNIYRDTSKMHKIYIGTQAKCTKYISGHKQNAQNIYQDTSKMHKIYIGTQVQCTKWWKQSSSINLKSLWLSSVSIVLWVFGCIPIYIFGFHHKQCASYLKYFTYLKFTPQISSGAAESLQDEMPLLLLWNGSAVTLPLCVLPYSLRTTTAETSWENSLFLLVLSPFHLVQPIQCLLGTLDAANRQSSSTTNLSKEKK